MIVRIVTKLINIFHNEESFYNWNYRTGWILFIKTSLEKDYEVHGTIRRSSLINTERIDPLIAKYSHDGQLNLYYSDLLDASSITTLIKTYNLMRYIILQLSLTFLFL